MNFIFTSAEFITSSSVVSRHGQAKSQMKWLSAMPVCGLKDYHFQFEFESDVVVMPPFISNLK